MKHPFIGITDFMSPDQVHLMRGVMRNRPSRHKLGVGVMMSYKTMHGLPTKWSTAFPKNDEIADIFTPETDVFNVLHYADYNNESSGHDFATALSYCGPHVHAIQFDMVWPDPACIEHAIYGPWQLLTGPAWKRFPVEVILQIGKNALEACNNDPAQVVEKLRYYTHAGVVDRVLLDKSMGTGKAMDAETLLPFAEAITKAFPRLGLVVAGGLGPDTIPLASPFIQRFPDASIDAQGQLRSSRNALDPIEWDRAARYLVAANDMFQKI